MKLISIVAVDRNNGVGLNNQLPWHLPADLNFFKTSTSGHYVIMGRKTFESLGKPLPNRVNIIITRSTDYFKENTIVFNDLDKAIQFCKNQKQDQVFITGGAEIYKIAIPVCDEIWITRIEEEFQVDTYFPIHGMQEFTLSKQLHHTKDEVNTFDYTFEFWTKNKV